MDAWKRERDAAVLEVRSWDVDTKIQTNGLFDEGGRLVDHFFGL